MYAQQQETKNLTTILKGVKIDLFGRILNTALRYGYVLLLARLLGAHLMGIFFLGVIIVEICGILSRLGLNSGVVKYVAIYGFQGDKARVKGTIYLSLMISLLSSMSIALLLYLISDVLAVHVFHKAELSAVLKILALSLPFSSMMYMAIHATVAFHTLKYRMIIENLMYPILNLLLVALFYWLGMNLSGVAYANVATFFVCGLTAVYLLGRIFPEIKVVEIKPVYEASILLKFSLPLLFVGVLNLFIMWTDILMLGYFKTASDVGIYNTAVRTAFFLNFIIISFTSIFAPRISELYHSGKLEQLQSLFKVISKWIFTLSLPLFLIILFQAKNVLSLFGAQFTAGAFSLSLLAAAYMLNASVGPVQNMLMMSEREKEVVVNTSLVCILNVLLNYLLIPRYGIAGAAVATSVSIVSINLVMLLQVSRYLRMHPFNLKYVKPVLSGIIVAFIAVMGRKLFASVHPFLELMLSGTLYMAIFFTLLRLFKFDEQDSLIIKLISNKLQ